MAPKLQPEIVSREIVKPSFFTPKKHPPTHTLSFFDQTSPCVYIPLLFFYTSKDGKTDSQRSNVLKISLSTTLSEFYPLAGRMKEDVTHECNDMGVEFLEATIECNLSDVLKIPNDETLKFLFPDNLYYKDYTLSSPVVVQVTYFKCGGMSIALCLSHKIQDMVSISNFLEKWASVATKSGREISPEFNMASIYPPLDHPFLNENKPAQEMKNCALRRVVFSPENISKLKALAKDQVTNPTRVEVVASLLHKSAVLATSKVSSSGCLNSTTMCHVMNLRTRILPSLSERNNGNFTGIFPVSTKEYREVEFGFLVSDFRKEKTRFSDFVAKVSNNEELYSVIFENMKAMGNYFSEENEQVYFCSSWCKYPFYEIDFGWGKPLWVTTVFWAMKNLILMIDTKEDGIETFVTLDERAMAVFEQDEELLSYCSFNPSVLE